jgi:hypothetical protein
MSTRSCILRPGLEHESPSGRYIHADGYPSGVGKTLYHAIREHFQGDIAAALKLLIDDHPAGWSALAGADFTLKPGFTNFSVPKKYRHKDGSTDWTAFWNSPLQRRPRCYCHGQRHEERADLTLDKASSWGCEYAYVVSPESRKLYVLSSYTKDGDKMIGMCGMGDEDAAWKLLAEVDLDGEEPDWEKLDRADDEDEA